MCRGLDEIYSFNIRLFQALFTRRYPYNKAQSFKYWYNLFLTINILIHVCSLKNAPENIATSIRVLEKDKNDNMENSLTILLLAYACGRVDVFCGLDNILPKWNGHQNKYTFNTLNLLLMESIELGRCAYSHKWFLICINCLRFTLIV